MTITNSQSEFKDFFLTIYLNGCEAPFRYEVSEAEFTRAKRVFDTDKAAVAPAIRFFCFDTTEGLTVAVSLKDVDLIHYLWEPIKHRLQECPEDKELSEEIKLYFRGRAEPFVTFIETPEMLYALSIELDSNIDPNHAFIEFTDEEGEDIAFNTQHLMVFEAPTDQIEEGQRLVRGQEDRNNDQQGEF